MKLEVFENSYKKVFFYKKNDLEISHYFGITHNENDLPAVIFRYMDGGPIRREIWYKDGLITRENNPAAIDYSRTGKIIQEEWWLNGKKNRILYPAVIAYDDFGIITTQNYWIDGREYTTEEFEVFLAQSNNLEIFR